MTPEQIREEARKITATTVGAANKRLGYPPAHWLDACGANLIVELIEKVIEENKNV